VGGGGSSAYDSNNTTQVESNTRALSTDRFLFEKEYEAMLSLSLASPLLKVLI
jgi:hypothetical protein